LLSTDAQKRAQKNHYNKIKGTDKETQRKKNIRDLRERTRLEIISHYSNGENKCACCGESHIEFLCIDHIGGLNEGEKRESNLYRTLKFWNFPEGYRVLCHNCNQSLGYYGYCPHNLLLEGTRDQIKFLKDPR